MNPGGVRADLTYASSTAGEGDGVVTYGEAFTVQPFGNLLVSIDPHRRADQDGARAAVGDPDRTVASGSCTWASRRASPTPARGRRRSAARSTPRTITLNGTPIDPAPAYRVTVNSFLADGGDGFTVLKEGTNRVGGGVDLDAFNAYLTANVSGHRPDAEPGHAAAVT